MHEQLAKNNIQVDAKFDIVDGASVPLLIELIGVLSGKEFTAEVKRESGDDEADGTDSDETTAGDINVSGLLRFCAVSEYPVMFNYSLRMRNFIG